MIEMGEGSNRFRGAAFGGFNRQDVLNHLAQVDREHSQTAEKLGGELETLRGEAAEQGAKLLQAESQLSQEQQVSQDLLSRLEKAQAALEEKTAAFDALESEAEVMRTAVSQLEPRALAYDRLKERTAAIELDAHERAQVTLEAARAEVETLRRQTLEWMREIQKSYLALCSRMEESFASSRQELTQIGDAFQRTSREFGEYGVAIEVLIRKAEVIADADGIQA
jgi:chromosome segregation ATPase